MSLGDSLRGLVMRYRGAHAEHLAASAALKAMDVETRFWQTSIPDRAKLCEAKDRVALVDRIAAAVGLATKLELEILRRLREGGSALDDLLLGYEE